MATFRIDRFLSLHFFLPLTRRIAAREIKVPILMYHGISHTKRRGVHPYYETTTSPSVFSRQMKFLKENGYQAIGLDALTDVWAGPAHQRLKYVVITFDDGLLDFFVTAHPILRGYGFSATVFLSAGLMGGKLAGRDVMSWGDAKALANDGVAFGSHSLTHPKLVEADRVELEREVRRSKNIIESQLGVKVDSFSYPYAFPEQNRRFVDYLEKLLGQCGYRRGVTTVIGRSSCHGRPFFLKRLPINDYDEASFFKAKLEGGYDWICALQRFSKHAKGALKWRRLRLHAE
jgi:peptidoglycan/xylan/chitin deacetylase (PgdA/CDA1 family)